MNDVSATFDVAVVGGGAGWESARPGDTASKPVSQAPAATAARADSMTTVWRWRQFRRRGRARGRPTASVGADTVLDLRDKGEQGEGLGHETELRWGSRGGMISKRDPLFGSNPKALLYRQSGKAWVSPG